MKGVMCEVCNENATCKWRWFTSWCWTFKCDCYDSVISLCWKRGLQCIGPTHVWFDSREQPLF
jgi:hypothetical protein